MLFFSDCENLRITLSDGSTFIKESALTNCSGLIEIHIPNSVSSIGANAFHNCTNLKNIIIPNKVTSIEERTFIDCKELVSKRTLTKEQHFFFFFPKHLPAKHSMANMAKSTKSRNCVPKAERLFSGRPTSVWESLFSQLSTSIWQR